MCQRSARTAALVSSLSLLIAPVSLGDDWTQWHGPNRNNISTETGWTPHGAEGNLWSRPVGLGYSNVVVGDGRLFTVGYNEDAERDTVFCLEPATGDIIWSQSYPARKWDRFHGGGSNSTPTIDGDKIYIFNREGEFRCFAADDGELLWEKDILDTYDVTLPTWGFAAAPLLLEDQIILNAGRAISFDRSTGEERWQSENYGHAYSTPVEFEHESRKLLAMFTGYGLIVLDRTNGKEIAKYEWTTRSDINPATPVVIGDRIFISSGYNHGCAMLRLSGNALTTLWESKDMQNQMTGCVVMNDHLFGFDQATLSCIDMDGNVKWTHRGLGQGAISGAGDLLMIAGGRGELIFAEPTPEAFTVVSKAEVNTDGGRHWTTPVLANGLVYLRSSKGQLTCRDHRATAEEDGSSN